MTDRKKILIIDSSPAFRHTLRTVIASGQQQLDIAEADNAAAAKRALQEDVPDILLVDIALPDGNGIDLIETLKEMAPEVIIIVLTSHDSAEHEHHSLQRGADYFLFKERSSCVNLLEIMRTAHRQRYRQAGKSVP
jgi:DNA-binding NarL/FixJ family response regulator